LDKSLKTIKLKHSITIEEKRESNL